MHVCHFCDTTVEGAYFENLTKGLLAHGIKVTLLDLSEHKPPTWLGKAPGVEYFNLGITNRLLYPLAVWRLSRFLKDKKIDVLQTHLYYSGLIGVLAKRLSKRTIVVLTRHHSGVVQMLGTRWHVGIDRWMAEQADHVVTPSLGTRDYIKNVDKIRNSVDVVYYGFDFEKLRARDGDRERVRDEFGFGDDDFVIGYIGNFAPGKGHIQLIRAFSKVVEKIPNARLFFVGRGMLDEVKDAIDELSLQGKVVFAGWRTDVAECLSAMDLFVQPSLSEAFSQVLVEAMSVGLPVVATEVGGAGEVIEDGKNGFLIEPNDPDAIAEKAIILFENPELRARFASAGQAKVWANFSYERTSSDQFKLYEKWLGPKIA
jgi:glycosyltransferase involved in cell wall biosynthesis